MMTIPDPPSVAVPSREPPPPDPVFARLLPLFDSYPEGN